VAGEYDDMKTMMKTLLVATALVAAVSSVEANATTIMFDNLPGDGSLITSGYSGLNWNNLGTYDGRDYASSGYVNGRVSGANVAYNQFGSPASISSATAFTLNSGYFTGAWNNGLTISVLGLVNGIQTYSDSFVVNASGSALHTFNWADLSSVSFSSAGGTNAGLDSSGTQFVLDNLTVNVAAVPEPATWAMMLVGFGMMGASMRYRRRSIKAVYA
jgi:hypothetical protein